MLTSSVVIFLRGVRIASELHAANAPRERYVAHGILIV